MANVIKKVAREDFLQLLEVLEPGLSPKEILEQSSCFVFQGGEIVTYNDEVACRIKSPLSPDFTGAVHSKPLLEMLRKIKTEEIEIEQAESALIIHSKKEKFGVRMDKEVNLPINMVDKPKLWNALHDEFGDAIGLVKGCASKDQSMQSLTCIHINPAWVEACDNYQIARWSLKTGFKQSTLAKKSAIGHISTLGMTEFSETESWVHFRNKQGLVLSCRRYVEEYPDFSRFLDVKGEPVTLPKFLGEAADKANVFSQENGSDNVVMVDLKSGRLILRSQGVSGWYRKPAKVKYEGPPLSFRISPMVLIDFLKRHTECTVVADRLKADGGSYCFVARLFPPADDNSNGESES